MSCVAWPLWFAKVTFNYLFIYYSSNLYLLWCLVRDSCANSFIHFVVSKRVDSAKKGEQTRKCQIYTKQKRRRCRTGETYNLIKLSLKTKTIAGAHTTYTHNIFAGLLGPRSSVFGRWAHRHQTMRHILKSPMKSTNDFGRTSGRHKL